uniref:Uncharacterized protein n=1 Tax=Anopheles farauti TaxID=69004 RepID=A0A182QRI1_9DIPT
MPGGRWWCACAFVWLWTIRCRALVAAETIHFTNSPKLIMASKNFTTYEIEVPGSKPITIIEANDPYERAPVPQPVQSFPATVQLAPGGPTTSFRTSTGLSVSQPTSSEEGSSSGTPEQSGNARKTLYSPELLTKFLKEYSEKLRNADSATRKRLNEITLINSGKRKENEQPTGSATASTPDQNQYRNRQPPAVEAIEAIGGSTRAPEDEPKTEDELVFDDTHERHGGFGVNSNKRWYQESGVAGAAGGGFQGHKNHPWNIKDGWVTLEAVPWSESKVSKWHANGGGSVPVKSSTAQYVALDRYWNGASDETSKYKPLATSGSIGASSYYGGAEPDDEYGYGYGGVDNRTPSSTAQPESLYNRRRPTVTLYSERPDAELSRPPSPSKQKQTQQQPPPFDSWYEQQQQQHLQLSDPYDAMKAYHDRGQAPGASPTTSHTHRDIITDGRPANFPKYAGTEPGPPSRGSYNADSGPSNHHDRPGTYPDRGNGEWVLISTTKGYQYPKRRHGQRAITFSPASATSHQTVKLTVLPMKNAVDMTTSHNGLIEVSASTQTVEDAVKQQKSKRKQGTGFGAHQPAQKKKNKHATGTGGQSATAFSLMRRDAAQDSSAVLAAVGAGMVPATMAILAPMVLGRKK